MDTPHAPFGGLPPAPDTGSAARSQLGAWLLAVAGVVVLALLAGSQLQFFGVVADVFAGQFAAGTAELRAAGCQEVLVLKGSAEPGEIGLCAHEADLTTVSCSWPAFRGKGPDCSEVARIYGKAAEDAPPIFLVVVDPGFRGDGCVGNYLRDGTPHDDLEHECEFLRSSATLDGDGLAAFEAAGCAKTESAFVQVEQESYQHELLCQHDASLPLGPDCATVARTYAEADAETVETDPSYHVRVFDISGWKLCDGYYNAQGTVYDASRRRGLAASGS